MFDLLSIDWGHKRTGLAFGSSLTELVIPYTHPCPTQHLSKILKEEIAKKSIKTLIVGWPTNFIGKKTEVTNKIEKFVHNIKKEYPNIRVETYNERNSSQKAREVSKDKDMINHLAAATILENYLKFDKK